MTEEFLILVRNAANGDEAAIIDLFNLFQSNVITNEQTEQLELFLKSQHTHQAIYLRGLIYKFGYSVRQDYDMSFLLMREAAAKGSAKATYEVGQHFLYGLGVTQNFTNALQWLNIAASSPYYIADAMYELAEMHAQGLGVEKNFIIAQEWYQKAADKGHLQAKNKLNK